MKRSPLNDDTQQYEKFRELAKKVFAGTRNELDKKFEEVKGHHQKKQAAVGKK